jgi:transcription elongation GreA/GreB family factor
MTTTIDMTADQVVLTREGRRLLEDRLGHLTRRTIPELRAALADREDDRPLYEYEREIRGSVRLERLLGAAVVAEGQSPGTDAIRLGDAVTVQLPDARERFLIVHPLEAPLDGVRISATSPLARAVLGRRAGDAVDVHSPAGVYRARILAVERAGIPVGGGGVAA